MALWEVAAKERIEFRDLSVRLGGAVPAGGRKRIPHFVHVSRISA